MTKKENPVFSREDQLELAIEQETQRVIADHLPTIFSVRNRETGKLYQPQDVEKHIRYFFSQVDMSIEQAAGRLSNSSLIPETVVRQLQLFFRQLYTVASIESHYRAIEAGRDAALKMVEGEESRIACYSASTMSGRLFYESARLLYAWDPYEVPKERPSRDVGVMLITDDVAHSGKQLRSLASNVRHYHDVPLIISVGVVTTRGREKINEVLGRKDLLIAQEGRPCLKELISQDPSTRRREQLTQLAEQFFRFQLEDPEVCLRATHIITPFKQPDACSNGKLAGVVEDGGYTYFAMRPVDSYQDRLYPKAL